MSKDKLTKLELEKKKKRELAEDIEDLKQTDKIGPEYVIQTQDKVASDMLTRKADVQTDLQGKKGQKYTYRRSLADLVWKKIDKIDWPDNWQYDAVPTDGKRDIRIYGRWFKTKEGVVAVLRSPQGKVFVRAVKTEYRPEVDYKAMGILCEQVENTLDSEKGILFESDGTKKTKSGIYLPN